MTKVTKAATPKPIAKKAIKPLPEATKTPQKRSAVLHTYGSELFEQSSVVLLAGCTPASLKQSALDYEAKLKAMHQTNPDIEIVKVTAYLAAYVDVLGKSLGQCMSISDIQNQVIDQHTADIPKLVKASTKATIKVMKEIKSGKGRVRGKLSGEKRAIKAKKWEVYELWKHWQKNPKNYKNNTAFAKDAIDKYYDENSGSTTSINDWRRDWEKGANIPIKPKNNS